MKWSIRKEVDGVITDDPKKYLEVCKQYNGGKISVSLRLWWGVIWFTSVAWIFGLLFRYRYPYKVKTREMRRNIEASAPILTQQI